MHFQTNCLDFVDLSPFVSSTFEYKNEMPFEHIQAIHFNCAHTRDTFQLLGDSVPIGGFS